MNWKLIALVIIGIILLIVGCSPRLRPLTVIPHPTAGFKVVIVPVGTNVGGFTTIEPGFYLTADVVMELLSRRDPELRLTEVTDAP